MDEKQQAFLTCLRTLLALKPFKPGTLLTGSHPLTNKALILSTGLFAVLGLFALWHKFVHPLPTWAAYFAIGIALMCQLSALLAIFIDVIRAIISFIMWKKTDAENFIKEAEHDQNNAARLAQFSSSALEQVEPYLSLKIKRLERRATSILGNGIAVTALLPLSVNLAKNWKQLDWLNDVYDALFINPWITALFYVFIFSLGCTLGALALKIKIAYYQHKLDTLGLALKEKSHGNQCAAD